MYTNWLKNQNNLWIKQSIKYTHNNGWCKKVVLIVLLLLINPIIITKTEKMIVMVKKICIVHWKLVKCKLEVLEIWIMGLMEEIKIVGITKIKIEWL